MFVTTAINELLESGCVVEQLNRHFCVNPLSVSVNKNGKERLILDLRHVNQFVEKRKIKFEGSKEALNYAKRGKFMVKFCLAIWPHFRPIFIYKAYERNCEILENTYFSGYYLFR